MIHKIPLLKTFIILIPLMIISNSFAQFPNGFQARLQNNSHQLYFNNKTLLGTGNAAVGCHLLGNQAKCFTINIIEQNGAMSCATALFDKNTGKAVKPWTKLLCGIFSFKELLQDPRTIVKSYDSDLLPEEELQALTAYYTKTRRISYNLDESGSVVIYVYGTLKTSDNMFQNTVRGIDNIIRSIKDPKLLKLLDGQRFVLINSGDTPSQMPGLFDLNLPTWIDNETRGASIFDISTTIISEEMNCKQNPTTYSTHNTLSKKKGPEQLVYFVAQTISDAFKMKAHIAEAVARGSFNKLPFIDELKNNQADIFPIITQAWFNANYSNPGPKNRSELLSHYSNIYNYLALFFNPQTRAVNICPLPAAKESVYNPVYNNQTVINNYTYKSYNQHFGFNRYAEFRDYYQRPSFIMFYGYNNQRYFDKHPNYRWSLFGHRWRDHSGNWNWSYKERRRSGGNINNINNNNITIVVNPTTGTVSTVPLSPSTATEASLNSSGSTTPNIDTPTMPLPAVEPTSTTSDNTSANNSPDLPNSATQTIPEVPGDGAPNLNPTPPLPAEEALPAPPSTNDNTTSTNLNDSTPNAPENDSSVPLPEINTPTVTPEPPTPTIADEVTYPPITDQPQTAPIESLPENTPFDLPEASTPLNDLQSAPITEPMVVPEPGTAPIVVEPQVQIPVTNFAPSEPQSSMSIPQNSPLIVEPSQPQAANQNPTSPTTDKQ